MGLNNTVKLDQSHTFQLLTSALLCYDPHATDLSHPCSNKLNKIRWNRLQEKKRNKGSTEPILALILVTSVKLGKKKS